MLSIYNTFTGRKEEFRPIEPGKVRMYVCGITTYDYCHLGHARCLVAFDIIVRYLRSRGFDVNYVRNITDIDDKILARAEENGELFSDLTERFIAAMHEDERALGIRPPDLEPRATVYMNEIIAMIETLVDSGHAYRTDNGDVYFSVLRFPEYGRLSNRNLDELLSGARVEPGELKRDPRDFALWKASPDEGVGWDSPWGYGRPGWHIECSAMSCCTLGEHFDIHGGGSDLIFPHHENEIAQSVAATGEPFANVWMHNGPLRIDDEKMSKSLGNFFTVRDVLSRHNAEVVRQFLISSHYRSPLNYSEQALAQSASALKRLYTALQGLDTAQARALVNSRFERAFNAAMDDDFNTPVAFRALFDLAREINRLKAEEGRSAAQLGRLLVKLGGVLGILQSDPEVFLKGADSEQVDTARVESLVAAREKARAEKNWREADRIRDQLSAMNVVVEDSAEGSRWRVVHDQAVRDSTPG
ncbi:MAG: cysteine--tRNA ligase [Gammaproteobacteria bacterium]|nr:cysteine--tRNA ligase [Gammaproteobacteria bacterium]MYH85937.1 cysteine--tRNA ligase [Gammaproteobacteria bacterium]MYK03365.1 cysteine--tRNA ligase [Gammaproteobacteria bacterium]